MSGISILYKAPEKLPPTLFAFLDPFSGTLWFSIGLSYVLVSITLFVVSRSVHTSSDSTPTQILAQVHTDGVGER